MVKNVTARKYPKVCKLRYIHYEVCIKQQGLFAIICILNFHLVLYSDTKKGARLYVWVSLLLHYRHHLLAHRWHHLGTAWVWTPFGSTKAIHAMCSLSGTCLFFSPSTVRQQNVGSKKAVPNYFQEEGDFSCREQRQLCRREAVQRGRGQHLQLATRKGSGSFLRSTACKEAISAGGDETFPEIKLP